MKCPVSYPVSPAGPGTQVLPCAQAATGYVVRFWYDAPSLRQVYVQGDWMFSDEAHSTRVDSARIWPHQWRPGLFPHTLLGLKETPKELKDQTPGEAIDVSQFAFDREILKLGLYEMDRGADGVFTCTIPLPPGRYSYRFVVDLPDGDPLRMTAVADPTNLPHAAPGEAPAYSAITVPAAAQPRGVLHDDTYPGLDGPLPCWVYLPDAPVPEGGFPVLYLSHGGGDSLSAWCNQGDLASILDRRTAEGGAPVAVVLMDNEHFRWNNGEKTIPNLLDCLIPWTEAHYPVARTPRGRAFAGLSAGGMLAFEVLEAAGDRFAAIGLWSGGQRFPADFSRPQFRAPRLHIGAGAYDDARFAFAEPLIAVLADRGIPCETCFPLGGHQWNVWRQLLADFLRRCFPG